MQRTTEPSICKFVLWWWFFHFLTAVLLQQEILFVIDPLIKLLSVHVRMWTHSASLQWTIYAQRKMPRIHKILRIHDEISLDGMNSLIIPFRTLLLLTDKDFVAPPSTQASYPSPIASKGTFSKQKIDSFT
jgi:hypothetical protein